MPLTPPSSARSCQQALLMGSAGGRSALLQSAAPIVCGSERAMRCSWRILDGLMAL